MMKLDKKIKKALKKMKLKPVEATENTINLKQQGIELGYESLGYEVTLPEKDIGLLVRLQDQTYNDGIYILRLLPSEKDPKIKALVVMVVIPNSISNDELTRRVTDKLNSEIELLDTSALSVFDWASIFGKVIKQNITLPLAKNLFASDDNKSKLMRSRFIDLYQIRFMRNIANISTGHEFTPEERVNAEPFVMKRQIEDLTDQQLNKVEKDNDKNNKTQSSSKNESVKEDDKK